MTESVYRFVFSLVVCVVLQTLCGLRADGQQNLFNVPSAEITEKDGLFFQQQFNIDKVSQSNTTISYGLGNDLELGMNVFQLELVPEEPLMPEANSPLFLFNVQKGFELGDSFKLGVGTQIGQSVLNSPAVVRLANFTYVTCVGALPDESGKLYVGPYFANATYRGHTGGDFGFMLGFDIPVVKDRFDLMGDFISGTSGIGVSVVGGVFNVGENWQISAGVQIPNPGSANVYGGVLELTYIPHLETHRDRSNFVFQGN